MSFILNRPSSLILEEPIKKIKMRKNTQISNFNDETTSRTKTATKYEQFKPKLTFLIILKHCHY